MAPIDRDAFSTLEEDYQEKIERKTDELVEFLEENPDQAYRQNDLHYNVLGEPEVEPYEMEDISKTLSEKDNVEVKREGSTIYFAISLENAQEN